MHWPVGFAACGCVRIPNAHCAARPRPSKTCRCTKVPWRPVPSEPLGILLLSGAHDRAHYAFVLASGAAAFGRHVVLFATNAGCTALLTDWSRLADVGGDEKVRSAGVAGLDELREA